MQSLVLERRSQIGLHRTLSATAGQLPETWPSHSRSEPDLLGAVGQVAPSTGVPGLAASPGCICGPVSWAVTCGQAGSR